MADEKLHTMRSSHDIRERSTDEDLGEVRVYALDDPIGDTDPAHGPAIAGGANFEICLIGAGFDGHVIPPW
jgi:hypothetical protein